MPQTCNYHIFFTNFDHKTNYRHCLEKFQCQNPEYSSTCYLAAYPEIFKCFSLELQVHGPFDWYFEHLYHSTDFQDQNGNQRFTGNTAPLTSQTTALVHLALNLWNGHKFDLAEGLLIWDSDLYKVALQAIDLRRRKPTLFLNKTINGR